MKQDVLHMRKIPFEYVSPPVCDFIFSASGTTEIFLSTRNQRGLVTGLFYTWNGATFRLQWNTYPGALCYSVYKLVDELDPFSSYILVAECITDNFIDLTDPGVYAVSAVDDKGETPFSDPVTVPPAPNACEGNQAPVGIGIETDACENTALDIDVSGANSDPEGYPLEIVSASADQGSVTWTGLVLVYTPPTDFYGDALITYVVQDPCYAQSSNNVLVHVWDAPEFTVPSLSTCDDTPIDINVNDYFTVNDGQTFTLTEASVDTGGSVAFVGNVITFTPTISYAGPVVLTYKIVGDCGTEYESDVDITVECSTCDFSAIGAWTEVSTAGVACNGGSQSSSGLNETVDATAVTDLFIGAPGCSPIVSVAGREVSYSYTGDSIDCRATITLSATSGSYSCQFVVKRNTITIVSDLKTSGGNHTYTVDFTIPASVAATIDITLVVSCGDFQPVPPQVNAGSITAHMVLGDQP